MWLVIYALVFLLGVCGYSVDVNEKEYDVPTDFLSPYGTYPNPLQMTEQYRSSLHPVIKFPPGDVEIRDYRFKMDGLASEEARRQRQKTRLRRRTVQVLQTAWKIVRIRGEKNDRTQSNKGFNIGRYDENRVGMYNSDMFQDTTYEIDGYSGARTVHLGIDLGAPINTPIYSFDDGIIHSAGYNDMLGDYGHVVVIEYNVTIANIKDVENNNPSFATFWALYGHLDRRGIRNLKQRVGQSVKKGEIVGYVGDIDDNGGWIGPHLHFQLSLIEPESHDMPGASSISDRNRALVQYPDPRYLLGQLY